MGAVLGWRNRKKRVEREEVEEKAMRSGTVPHGRGRNDNCYDGELGGRDEAVL